MKNPINTLLALLVAAVGSMTLAGCATRSSEGDGRVRTAFIVPADDSYRAQDSFYWSTKETLNP